MKAVFGWVLIGLASSGFALGSYDIDDSMLHKVTFGPPDIEERPEEVKLSSGTTLPLNQDDRNVKKVVVDKMSPTPTDDDVGERMVMTTKHNEKYICTLPKIHNNEEFINDNYNGQSALDLLEPLFESKMCAYRLEHYWTYELCHGRYLRQYHEEREGSKVKTSEYYLGKYDEDKFKADKEALRKQIDEGKDKKPKKKRVESINMPYYEMMMVDGTICDLSGLPRKTRIHYVCYPSGQHQMYSFKESSTCEYEVMVLSPLLCAHPDFRPESAHERNINCVPADQQTQDEPEDLMTMEKENAEVRSQLKNKVEGTFITNGRNSVKLSIKSVNPEGSYEPDHQPVKPVRPPFEPLTDPVVVREFLTGTHCLYGGSGWWKYEFCYGKSVSQYHEENGQRVSVINLGVYNKQKHLEFIKDNPSKAPHKTTAMRKQVTHLYSDGDFCDLAKKNRHVEVKLKCKKSDSPSAVSLYLMEPKTCEYILGVESPIICDILPGADENGLMDFKLEDFDGTVKQPENNQENVRYIKRDGKMYKVDENGAIMVDDDISENVEESNQEKPQDDPKN